MQLFARFEPHRATRRNRHLGPGSRISTDARLPWPYVEHPKAPQFNPLAFGQRVLQALKNGVHGMFGLVPWQSCPFNYAMNNVLLNQCRTSWFLLSG